MKQTYQSIVNEIQPALIAVSKLSFPMSVPMSHHVAIIENMEKADKVAKTFFAAREKLVNSLCDKDEDGNPKVVDVEGGKSYTFSAESQALFTEKLNELSEEEVDVDFLQLMKEHFEGVEGLKPIVLKGIFSIIK